MVYAKKGSYVVKTEDTWVYDVEIFDDETLIAVVGFTQTQKEGAVFWQISLEKSINYDYQMVQCIGRNYFLNKR